MNDPVALLEARQTVRQRKTGQDMRLKATTPAVVVIGAMPCRCTVSRHGYLYYWHLQEDRADTASAHGPAQIPLSGQFQFEIPAEMLQGMMGGGVVDSKS